MLFSHISNIALRLERATEEQEIFREVADKLYELYPDVYIIITLISPQKNSYKIHVLKGLEKFKNKIDSLIGTDILSMEFPLEDLSDIDRRLNSNSKLNLVRGGIHTVAQKRIPKSVSKAIEKLLGVYRVYSLGMVLDEDNFGNITIFTRQGYHFPQTDIRFIETLSVIGAIALQKIRARHQMKKDAEKIQQIFHTVPVGIGIVIDRVIQEVNERICEMLGYSKEELMNQNARLVYPSDEMYEYVGKEKYRLLRETGTGQVETIWKCKNGDLKNILLRSSAINPADLSEGVIFTALDITQKKETEKALIESEERYRKLVESAPLAVLIHSKGIIRYVNKKACDLLNYKSPDELIGKQALAIVHPDDLATTKARIETMYKTGQPAPITEERFLTGDNQTITVQVAGTLIDYQGELATLVFGLDVTELRSVESEVLRYSKELEEINMAKDKFFSIIAHDLKGPFNSILGFADILHTEFDEYSDEERKHFIRNIASSAQNTYRLLENLLEWSRAQTNRLDFKPEVLELSSVINDSILLVRGQAETKDIHIFSAVEFNTRVLADENMAKTITRNLLSNAIKFSKRRGNVRVMEKHITHQETRKKMIEVMVKDDGVGMSPAVLEQIFRIDQMIKTPGTDNEKGTGLGLILCRELVMRNGGTIWAESKPGKGTTLHFTLPKA